MSAGVTTMKMMSRTSMTSIIGVTFGCEATPPPAVLLPIAIELPPQWDETTQVEIGALPPDDALNSRVKRDRPNSPDTPLMR